MVSNGTCQELFRRSCKINPFLDRLRSPSTAKTPGRHIMTPIWLKTHVLTPVAFKPPRIRFKRLSMFYDLLIGFHLNEALRTVFSRILEYCDHIAWEGLSNFLSCDSK